MARGKKKNQRSRSTVERERGPGGLGNTPYEGIYEEVKPPSRTGQGKRHRKGRRDVPAIRAMKLASRPS